MSTDTSGLRASRLSKQLHSILSGAQSVTRHNYALFLEAIYTAPDAATCISKLIASDTGLLSLQASFRFELTPVFFNGPATALLRCLSSPTLGSIDSGKFIQLVLLSIVEPPIFWTSFKKAFLDGLLQEDARFSFAWLLLQLISLPGEQARPHRQFAEDPKVLGTLLTSSQSEIRSAAQKIKHIIATCSIGASPDLEYGPGGRHDNDFVDFREIAILPTADELSSKEMAFLRKTAALDDYNKENNFLATHLDNQFRLLREDMLYEMREELQVALGSKKGKHRGFVIDGLTLQHIYTENSNGRTCKLAIALTCQLDLWQFRRDKPKDRKGYLQDNRNILKHQSMACLIVNGEIAVFVTVNRDEDLLAKTPPTIVLQIEDERSTAKALLKLRGSKDIKLLQIDTAIFAYQPILTALQKKQVLYLEDELLFWKRGSPLSSPQNQPSQIVDIIKADPLQNLQSLLRTPQSVVLDKAQADSLLSGLTQRVSLIQGPPGTGKSYIGALLAKILHDFASQTILVICYTNHALDQFLEDLLDIGIPETSIVRLGGKSTPRTAALAIQKSKTKNRSRKGAHWEIDILKTNTTDLSLKLNESFQKYMHNIQTGAILDHLEFDHPAYFQAFQVPQSTDGMQRVGKKGRVAGPDYLLVRWLSGEDAGNFRDAPHVRETADIWNMPRKSRVSQISRWKEEMLKDLVEHFCTIAKNYNLSQRRLDRLFAEGDLEILRSKRIIGCTTTAAAKYCEDINAACPGVLLVEEAGEILESHVLTALGAETKQLILIGDHKQLRPKVNNYLLTVEKDEGYDLNRSLFERLILKGYPHETLRQQHRMRPEISELVRQLTYPELLDAPKTRNRPDLRGVQDNVVFINHEKPEVDTSLLEDRRDCGAKASKKNKFEAGMILKIVRYLGQQGYGTSKLVILTPYLGQLRELQEALKKENDPILNDLDSYDLIRAGLVSSSAAGLDRPPIRIATIDNYQGEESDIVIVSLTRSNAAHDIGFMSSPERLTVLLSRARNAIIMIGNAHTFMNARKGSEIWKKLFDLLKGGGHIYDGLPVKCERHPNRTRLLKCPEDFDKECPDGGCLEPCPAVLQCNLHPCPSKCHQLVDHSKMPCEHILYSKCPKGHSQQWKCHNGAPKSCNTCYRENKIAEKKRKEEFDLQEKREEEQRLHARQVAEIDAKINKEREALRDVQLSEERRRVIEQKLKDLAQTAALTAQAVLALSSPKTVSPPEIIASPLNAKTGDQKTAGTALPSNAHAAKDPQPALKSAAREKWLHQKDVNGECNDAIDAIMEMTGLEEVKEQVLRIKDKVDTTKRQGSSIAGERFNVTMLGNPGTGKTTVARHYSKFLTSIQVIPGNTFIETTGSRLANDGVSGIKKQLEEVIEGGGGTIFIDEAYQLIGSQNLHGSQVLDFLLAEMENVVGKIVFIFAGYNKEMEKFFEHNPGLKSRVPYSLQFKDYEDPELLDMLETLVTKTFQGKMKVEDGIRGLYGRIAVRRLGRGRGRNGFGNARALRNLFDKIRERQAQRLSEERLQGKQPDDFLLQKEDLIGPEPSKVMTQSAAWKKLQSMIGLTSVKDTVTRLFSMASTNYERELLEKEPHAISLNRVFLGSPGTGKTTVAKHYGQILGNLGLISNGNEVVVKNPADFIGSALGQSESQTKAILANTVGKVLVIDEAYMLYGGSSGNNGADPYKTAVIDTIVAEVQSVPGEDRCVLLLGYKEQIEEMFQNVNPGLARRFAIEDAFHFHDYTDSELLKALEWKLKDQDLTATDTAKRVAIEVLSRARNRPNFGNIGEVENLLSKAKVQYQARQSSLPIEKRSPDVPFEPQDFDPDFNRNEHSAENLTKLFEDVVGCEDTIQKLRNWQQMARNMKAAGKDPRDYIPTNFIFKGPPGTGKTTIARKMGQVYYDMGFLSSTEVVECSASDLVGQYVGHTGPKTKKLFEKALGRVLFIDEAYRLGEGHFAKEAMDELVGILTLEKFRAKLIVILAGYDQEMNTLMAVNSGLSSRFPAEIVLHSLPIAHCLEILRKKLTKESIRVDALEDTSSPDHKRIVNMLKEFSRLPSWGNARDLTELVKRMVTAKFTIVSPISSATESGPTGLLKLADKDAVECIESMLHERQERTKNVLTRSYPIQGMPPVQDQPSEPPLPPAVRTTQESHKSTPPPQPKTKQAAVVGPVAIDCRDAGVRDDVWRQLQIDKQASEEAARRSEEARRSFEQKLLDAKKREGEMQALAKKLAEDNGERAELMREREEARIQELAARAELARIAAALKEKERMDREEMRVQQKLRNLGVCVAGFQWIKQASGYRCAGGSHFIGNAALGI